MKYSSEFKTTLSDPVDEQQWRTLGEGAAYRIVGPAEANPKAGTVSYESAMGKALLGHRVGEEVEVKTPNGSYRVRIVGIE